MLIPLIFIVLPVLSIGMILVFFNIPVRREVGELAFLLVDCYASCNSLLTLFFVTPYRIYTRELILKGANAIIRRAGKVFGMEMKINAVELKPGTESVKGFAIVKRKVAPH